MIIGNDIQVKWSKNNKSYFVEKGYVFTQYGDTFKVDLKDLKSNMSYKVDCKCDFCGKIFYRMYYLVSFRERHSCGNKCKKFLQKETNIERYGCECCLQNEDIHKKTQKTLIDRYGADEVWKSQDIINKRLNTFKNNYSDEFKKKQLQLKREESRKNTTGYATPFHDPSIRKHAKETLIEHLGVDNPWKSPEVREKIKQTNILRYGTEHIAQNEEKCHLMIKNMIKTQCENNQIKVSRPQKYLTKLFHAKINYPFDIYALDMVLIDEKIDIEYDGGGHHRFDTEEHDKKRDEFLIENDWKIIRISSKNDYLYDKECLLLLLAKSLNELKICNKVIIDIDNNLFIGNEKEFINFHKSKDYLKELK